MSKGGSADCVKLVVIGDSSVGKTALLRRFCNNEFDPSFASTIGIDFYIRNVGPHKLQIWDTAGQERYKAVMSAYYRGARGVLLVFALNDHASFEHAARWLAEFQATLNPLAALDQSPPILCLVGNKCDVQEFRSVTRTEAEAWAATHAGMAYVETSAKTGQGVSECFEALTARLAPVAHAVEEPAKPPPPDGGCEC